MNDTATQTGAADTPTLDPDVDTSQEVEVKLSPRDAALAAMGDRQEQMRQEELQEAIENDPGLAANQAAIEKEIAEANAEAGITHEPDDTPSFGPVGSDDGAASRQAMHEPEPHPDLPGTLQDDPLADFIEMHDGQPMVKLKVNGQEGLLPLADAKRQLQIGVSAEVRMQTAAERENALDARERKLTAGEAALSARMSTIAQPQQPATPAQPQPGLSDEDLHEEAQGIFNTAFSGTEEDAAGKLAKTLIKIRDSAGRAAPTQVVDPHAIAQEAAALATGTLTRQSRKKDVATGYQSFKDNYPEIVNDPRLFKMADDLTEVIEREHPDWNIADVMDEAGKRTRDWVKGLTGQPQDTEVDDPAPTPGDQNSPTVSEATTQHRQQRKAGLIPMPTQAGAAVHQEPEEPSDDGGQSPQEAFLELKKARGQPV